MARPALANESSRCSAQSLHLFLQNGRNQSQPRRPLNSHDKAAGILINWDGRIPAMQLHCVFRIGLGFTAPYRRRSTQLQTHFPGKRLKNPPPITSRFWTIRSAQARGHHGFALVVTLSLLVLLTIIALGLLSLSSISLRAGSNAQAMATARANARMALIMAGVI